MSQAAGGKPKPGPIDAAVVVDQAGAASAQITAVDGGTVALTAPNGTRVTVEFPAGAVPEDTFVTATPVTKLSSRSMPRGLLAGVQLQPEGLTLAKPATVRFDRAGKAPRGRNLVFVGSEGTGQDVHLLPPPVRVSGRGKKRRVVLTGKPEVSILHFSTVDAFDWSKATVEEINAINRPELGIHALSQEIGRLLSERPPDWYEIEKAFERAQKRLIAPMLSQAIASAAQNCTEASLVRGKTAMTTALSFDRQAGLLGIESANGEKLVELLTAVGNCMTKLCPTLGDPRVAAYFLAFGRSLALYGIGNDAYFAALNENMIRCGAFELHIDAEIHQVFESHDFFFRVDGRVKYVPTGDSAPNRPRGPLTYVSTSGQGVLPCQTYEVSKTTDGEFELTDIQLSKYDPANLSLPPVESLKITVTVPPVETYHYRSTSPPPCSQAGYDQDAQGWFSAFQSQHFGAYPALAFPGNDFLRDTAPVFALAVYSPNTHAYPGGTISENTLVEIIHTPEPLLPLPDPG